MPPVRRVASVLANRSVPSRTRVRLLGVEVRRRLAPQSVYDVPYPSADLFLTHDDFEIDWEMLKSVVADGVYSTDYQDAVVLDIGAHKGYFSAFALAHGAQRVVSFEPEDVNADVIARSIDTSAHPAGAWEVEVAAVGSANGEAELHVMAGSWGHALEPPASWGEYEVRTQLVRVVALADVVAREAAGSPRMVVKMNIEGAECDVVLGTSIETWQAVDEVMVATHPWAACTDTDIERHLGVAGLTRSPSEHRRVLRLRREARSRCGPRSDPT